MSQELRIFISSPGDVTPERLIAKRIIERLAREFEHHCKIEPVLWERQPLIATEHFQKTIDPPPSKTEIVVVVIWSRLGTALPQDKFPGPVTGGEVTGTEWEFEDAVNSYRQRKFPDILLYHKQATVMASLEDDAELERQRAQKRMVEDFVHHWLVDEEAGTFKAASHPFKASAEFEDMLETHLRELISRHIDIKDTDEGRPPWHEGSPFRGLEAFEVKHAPIFFGRTRARNELREVLVRQASRGCAFVMVFGASGSGKSSLVKAGLLPDLMLPGMVENVGVCRVALMRPSDNPEDLFAGLSAALLRTSDQSQKTEATQVMALPELIELEYDTTSLASQLRDASNALLPIKQGLKLALKQARKTAKLADHAEARLAIVVDQLEELFTLDCPETDRQSLVNTLTALARSGQVWVIATMRSDFFDRLAKLPELVQLSQGEGRYLLMPPSEAEIGQIIGQPAQAAGLRFETREDGIPLNEKLREVAGKDPSALPLLEFTLEQLWHQRSDNGMLNFKAYERLGGMEGALGKRAEEVFRKQPEEVQQALPKVLRALVTIGQEEHATATARTALLDSFPEGTPQRQLVDAFLHPTARLLIADEGGQVRITHEALLSHWTQAANYIRKNRQDLQTRTRVEKAAADWVKQQGKDPALLLAPGKPLADAEDLLARYSDELDEQIIEFIEASSARARRKKRRLVAFAIGASVLAIIAMIGAYYGITGKNEAERQRKIALTRQLVAQASNYTSDQFDLALLLSLSVNKITDSVEVRGNLLEVLTSNPSLIGYLRGHTGHINSLSFSPGNPLLASAGSDGSIILWNQATLKPLGRPLRGHNDEIFSIAFSPNGRLLASGGRDRTIKLWDVATGKQFGSSFPGQKDHVRSVAFSPDGTYLASGSKDSSVTLWVVKTQERLELPKEHTRQVNSIAFSPDGQILASGDDGSNIILWDVDKRLRFGRSLTEHESWILSLTFIPFGQTLVSSSGDSSIILWDVDRQKLIDQLHGHPSWVLSVAVSPDGKTLASGGQEGAIILWDIIAKRQPRGVPLIAHSGAVKSLTFDQEGNTFASSGVDDNFIVLWDLEAKQGISERLEGPSHQWNSVTISRDGRTIASSGDNNIFLWDVKNKKAYEKPLSGHTRQVKSVAFSPDGKLLASASRDKSVILWNVATGERFGSPLIGHTEEVLTVAFSPDGKTLASGGKDNVVILWDLKEQNEIRKFEGHKYWILSVAFSPDGKKLATGSWDRSARIWNISTAETEITIDPELDLVHEVAFSPDGRILAIGSYPRTLTLWDLTTNQFFGDRDPLTNHKTEVYTVAFSPDNRLLASGSRDRTIILWDIATRKPLGPPLTGHVESIHSLTFSPDGRTLISGSKDGTIMIWDISFESWMARACRIANRNLTPSEWGEFVGPDIAYERVCPDHSISVD